MLSPKYRYLRKSSVRAGDIAVDPGANVGEVTDCWKRTKKYPEFRKKGEILQKKINESPYKDRIHADWF